MLTNEEVEKKTDVQLVFMLLLQMIMIFSSTLPFALQKNVSTLNPTKTIYQLGVENFFFCLTRHFSFINSFFFVFSFIY
jgi:hypothetical protein